MLNFGFKKEKMKFEALSMKLWASLKQEINQRNAQRFHRGQCPGIFRAPRRPQEAKEAGRANGEWWVPEFTTNKTAENVKQLIG